jgi:hypothetical protein
MDLKTSLSMCANPAGRGWLAAQQLGREAVHGQNYEECSCGGGRGLCAGGARAGFGDQQLQRGNDPCSCQPDDPLYAEALQFCYGYMAGVAQ